MRDVVLAIATAALLAGCGSSAVLSDVEPVASPYSGPMYVPIDDPDDASVIDRSGAAGRALECDGDPYNGGAGDYDTGLASVQGSAVRALETFLEEDLIEQLPAHGYRVERKNDRRVLFSYDVGKRTKVAFVVADGVRDYNDDEGWGVEAWAQCDPVELPPRCVRRARHPGVGGPDGCACSSDAGSVLPRRRALRLAGHHVPPARGDEGTRTVRPGRGW